MHLTYYKPYSEVVAFPGTDVRAIVIPLSTLMDHETPFLPVMKPKPTVVVLTEADRSRTEKTFSGANYVTRADEPPGTPENPVLKLITSEELKAKMDNKVEASIPAFTTVTVPYPHPRNRKAPANAGEDDMITIRCQSLGHPVENPRTFGEINQGIQNYVSEHPYNLFGQNCQTLVEAYLDPFLGVKTHPHTRTTKLVDKAMKGADYIYSAFKDSPPPPSLAGLLFSSTKPESEPGEEVPSNMIDDLPSWSGFDPSLRGCELILPERNFEIPSHLGPSIPMQPETPFSRIPESHREMWRESLQGREGGEGVSALGVTAAGVALSAVTGGTVTLVPGAGGGVMISVVMAMNPVAATILGTSIVAGGLVALWNWSRSSYDSEASFDM